MNAADFDLLDNLRETIVLLGGEKEIADLLLKSQDGLIREADIVKLRQYNISLFANVKSRLHNLKQVKMVVNPET
jgi:hypothetical protein